MRSLVDPLLQRLRDPGLVGQILRFTVVGGLGFIVDAGVLQTLVFLGAGPVVGRVFSLATAVTFTWLLNRNLTFAPQKPPSWREFRHYVAVSMVGLVINYGLYWVATVLGAPILLALALGTLAGSAFNFVRYRVLLSGAAGPEDQPGR